MKILMVPVIMLCALGGTIGLLKLIGHFFPGAVLFEKKAREWAENTSEKEE